jgi:hypothetical protein
MTLKSEVERKSEIKSQIEEVSAAGFGNPLLVTRLAHIAVGRGFTSLL